MNTMGIVCYEILRLV